MATTILLARHGETDWNVERRVQGHVDRPLTERGRAQAVALADALRGERIDAVYSSDLARARDTARIVADSIGSSVAELPELREKNFGTWEGLTDSEVLDRFPHARGTSWGDGETSEELAARVVGALQRIARDHPGGQVLVVAHGGPLRAALRHCGAAADSGVPNCHVIRIAAEDGRMRTID
jgi:broad specificity phosphatase PhoE